jgi:voltage-gated potassium channel
MKAPDTDGGHELGSRQGWTLSQRLRAPDSYGLLLFLILGALVCSAALGESVWGSLLTVIIQALTLVYALWTSRASKRVIRAGLGLTVVAVLVAIAGSIRGGASDLGAALLAAASGVLAIAAPVAIVRRVAKNLVISGSTVLAAICIYLTSGMFFAAVYAFIAAVGSDPFFAQEGARSAIDYLYFSFVTQTTVGYGDLTAAQNLGRMLAVTQALAGQVYLVTVVALLVANIGRERRPRSRDGS